MVRIEARIDLRRQERRKVKGHWQMKYLGLATARKYLKTLSPRKYKVQTSIKNRMLFIQAETI